MIFALIYGIVGLAQETGDLDAIKLFIDKNDVQLENSEDLNDPQADRLFQRVSQLMNRVGITEYGYSTFLVTPKLDVISVTESDAGIAKTVLAECELFLTVKRVFNSTRKQTEGSATMNTYSKKIMGSGYTKSEAISNAISNINSLDKNDGIKKFFEITKKKINDYYQNPVNCDNVLKEAKQALAMKNYRKSIALSFSVPTNAPCYKKAYDDAILVYNTYIEDECERQLIQMKIHAALAQKSDADFKTHCDSVVKIMGEIEPSAEKCYAAAKVIIAGIEQKLNEQQKREWEAYKLTVTDRNRLERERLKAIQKINVNYVPSETIIIK